MDIVSEIAKIVGSENVFDDQVECIANSRDWTVHEGIPDAVVYAQTAEQVSAIMKIANRERIPVTPRGTGSSLTGAALAVKGGLVLDVHRMNRILEINKKDFYARVEPGIICAQFNAVLGKQNLMFPPNPGSEAIATIGGMVSTNASGHRAVKYGTTRDYVKGLKVVLADGTLIETGFKAPKNSMGYDLTHLFANSEGTLGVIVEVRLKIQLLPEYGALAMVMFNDINAAGDTVTEIITSGIELTSCEILDKYSLKIIQKALGRDVSGVEAMLVMEADGAKEVVLRDMKRIEAICKGYEVREFTWTDDPAKSAEIMEARGRLAPAMTRLKPGHQPMAIGEDVGVPMTKVPATIRRAQEIAEKHDLIFCAFGHVGDGNMHTGFAIDLRSKDEFARLRLASDELSELALEMGGTISAEHGMGVSRAPYMEMQFGPVMDIMRGIKKTLDPNGILNPGKLGLEKEKHDIYDYFAFNTLLDHPEGVDSFGPDLDNEILACIHCGFCRLGCPTFEATHLESKNARGRNILAFKMLNGEIEPSKELAESFFTCTTCQACTYFCPAQIKVDEIIQKGRQKIYGAGVVPEPVVALRDNILKTNNVYAISQKERTAIYPKPVREKAETGLLKRQADVLLFMGCVPSFLDMKIVPSFIDAIEASGADYTTLGMEEPCCGFPLYLMGNEAEFERHAGTVIDLIRKTGASKLVTPCAGCFKSFKKIYPQVTDLGIEILHSVHYLKELVDEGNIKLEKEVAKKVTYHDPCDLGRSFQVFEEPREILKGIPGLELVEMGRNRLMARCCGGGGSTMALAPDMAAEIASVRIKDALAVGAEVIVSGCSACKDNLKKGIKAIPKKERGPIKVMDLTELVVKSMR